MITCCKRLGGTDTRVLVGDRAATMPRIQLDTVGHDLQPAPFWPGTLQKLRTPRGQRLGFTRPGMDNPQVIEYSGGLGWAPCKTVGLAYVGSNPTPATTCGNGP